MNRWDILPCDVQNYIKSIDAAQKIQQNFRGYHCRKIYALNIAKKYTNKNSNSMDCTDPRTATEIGYCMKHGSLCKNTRIWYAFIEAIEQCLWEKKYTEASCTQLYQRIDKNRRKLSEQLQLLRDRKHFAYPLRPAEWW
jgi:hypothetical protein